MIRFDRSALRTGFGRDVVLDLLERGLAAIDPQRLVEDTLSFDGDRLWVGASVRRVSGRRVWAIAIGKAAAPMAQAASARLGPALAGGIVLTRNGYGEAVDGLTVVEAGHPIPDEVGGRAAREIAQLADHVGAGDLVLCLLSGGGSALLAAPPAGVSIDDLACTGRLLLESGAPIEEINTVRRHLSSLQGGRLARCLRPAVVVTLALSDVLGDRPEAIASGPTVPDPTTYDDAVLVLRRHRLWDRVPASVRDHLIRGSRGAVTETPKPGDPAFSEDTFEIVGNRGTFLDAVVRAGAAAGWGVIRLDEAMAGEARGVGRNLGRQVVGLASGEPGHTIWTAGGETTVTVRGSGRGGRNQELALAAAREMAGADRVCLAALATDGTDGVTDAAGALVDGETVGRVRRAGIDPTAALEDNDSYAALRSSGDLLYTGPTRTNVADISVAFIERTRTRL